MALDFRVQRLAHVLGGDHFLSIVPRSVAGFARQIGEIEKSRRDFSAAPGQAHAVLQDRRDGGAVKGQKLFVVAKFAQAAGILRG